MFLAGLGRAARSFVDHVPQDFLGEVYLQLLALDGRHRLDGLRATVSKHTHKQHPVLCRNSGSPTWISVCLLISLYFVANPDFRVLQGNNS